MREVALQVESNEKAPGITRSHLAAIRDTLEPRYDDIALVVSELVTNSVRHSVTRGIDVTVRANPTLVRIEVTDDGPGFSRDDPRGDGMGLAVVEKLADQWGMTDSRRFTVWAELAK
jgi:anti-sigma regulatory factor (Ser/Thr protein kinase)